MPGASVNHFDITRHLGGTEWTLGIDYAGGVAGFPITPEEVPIYTDLIRRCSRAEFDPDESSLNFYFDPGVENRVLVTPPALTP